MFLFRVIDIYEIFSYLSFPVLIFGIVLGIMNSKVSNPMVKYILAYFIFSLGFDVVSRFLNEFNLYLYPLYGIVELYLFSAIYEKFLIKKKSYFRLILRILIYVLFIYEFYYSVIYMEPRSYTDYGMIMMVLYVFGCGILFIRKVFTSETLDYSKQLFSFNIGILVYFGYQVIFFSSFNFLVNASEYLVDWFWYIFLFTNLFFNLILIKMLWQTGKTRKPLQCG